jgi:hypothetical protein
VNTRRRVWLIAIRRYLIAMAVGNLLWETAQLPLYTLWGTGTPTAIAAAVLHCTLGDMAIAIIVLVLALALFGAPAWPDEKFWAVLMAALAGGVSYTVYSEYTNTVVRASWVYSAWMPTLPVLGIGIAPLAQWVMVPAVSVFWAARAARKWSLPQARPNPQSKNENSALRNSASCAQRRSASFDGCRHDGLCQQIRRITAACAESAAPPLLTPVCHLDEQKQETYSSSKNKNGQGSVGPRSRNCQ